MKRKQITFITSIIIIGIIAIAGTFAFKHNKKEKAYNTLLTKADKSMEEHNFKDAKSLYEESLVIKDNKEIQSKLDLIKNTEDSLEKLNTIEPLVQENKFDEATEVLNRIKSPSEYVSSEVKNKTEKVSKLKEDFLEKQRISKKAEEKRIAEEKRQTEEERKAKERKQVEEKKKFEGKALNEEKKQIEEKRSIGGKSIANVQKKQQVTYEQNATYQNNNEPPISSDHYKKCNLPSNEYNIRKVIVYEVRTPIYISPDQALNVVAKNYFSRNPKVKVREPLFSILLEDGSYWVDVQLNHSAVEYEVSPLDGDFKYRGKINPDCIETP